MSRLSAVKGMRADRGIKNVVAEPVSNNEVSVVTTYGLISRQCFNEGEAICIAETTDMNNPDIPAVPSV